jgi:restriction endonuclease S subunit
MKIKIKHLSTVQMGYSFRGRLEIEQKGNISVVQMKDLIKDNTVSCANIVKIEMEQSKLKKHHLIKKGDLVFRSRGQITTSAILLKDLGKAVVAAPLLKIRIKKNKLILPEYLNWYINQEDAQRFLTKRSKRTGQKMISKKAIEDLEVNLPDIQMQQHIIELAKLSHLETVLMNKISKKRNQYISKVLMDLTKE